jgi:ribosomal protein S18 acetylase RimI-like enzyme
MATIQNVYVTPSRPGRLRPFDMRRDLLAVADLVELCFRGTIDPDGQRYLRHMRSAAQNKSLLRWIGAVAEPNNMPLSGYVWEEQGRLVGNLSLIPFSAGGSRLYLIANVAVHPDYRRKGIARALTSAAFEHTLRRGSRTIWLQVRQENEAAMRLYRSMGFSERARRTTWQNWYRQPVDSDWRMVASQHGYNLFSRRDDQAGLHKAWFERLYPHELAWHFSLDWSALQPGLLAAAVRLLTGSFYQHWSVTKNGSLIAILSRQRTTSYADHLWLGLPEDHEEAAVEVLLKYARKQVSLRRPLTIDFPAGMAEAPIERAGFSRHQTLIWMSASLQ